MLISTTTSHLDPLPVPTSSTCIPAEAQTARTRLLLLSILLLDLLVERLLDRELTTLSEQSGVLRVREKTLLLGCAQGKQT